MKIAKKVLPVLICLLSLYVVVSYGVYRFKHSEMTETQLLMKRESFCGRIDV